MHILFLTQVLPYPLDAGPKVRAYYTLRYLASKHKVTLLSFVRPSDPPAAVDHLRSLCAAVHTLPMLRSPWRDGWHLLRSLATDSPFLIARDWMPEMAWLIERIVHESGAIDAVHADQLWMAPYALHAKEAANGRQPQIVLDQHNAVFQIPRRLAEHEGNPLKRLVLSLEARKLVRFEQETCRQFDHVAWVTEEDRMALRQTQTNGHASGQKEELTIPICVDPQSTRTVQPRNHRCRVTFLGGMHWPPNAEGIAWFAREVWPRVQAQVPDSVLTLIGKQPPALFTKDLNAPPESIDVTGYVEDLNPYLEETAVFIVPLHAGGGMRVKILDAWCWGLPVVSTAIGAEGLAACHGQNLLLADSAEEFAAAVVQLLQKPDLAKTIGYGGRQTVEAQYNWQHIYQAWDKIYLC
jgi:glycosyltransferase involved in cell wall biosynthesis